jgi:hypothetical protein
MKKKLQIFAVLMTIVFSTSVCTFAQDSDAAIEYNNTMINIQARVDASLVDLITAIESNDTELMASAKTSTLTMIKAAQKDLSAVEKFGGSSDFKKELKALIAMYKSVTTKELTTVIKLLSKEGELTDEEWAEYDAMFDSALVKYNAGFERFNAYQEKFAADWDFIINE